MGGRFEQQRHVEGNNKVNGAGQGQKRTAKGPEKGRGRAHELEMATCKTHHDNEIYYL